jgi:tritrans,polycis-undecaprenyl-diphosphate synthase [geranylgeranyl-diphosphate specific]
MSSIKFAAVLLYVLTFPGARTAFYEARHATDHIVLYVLITFLFRKSGAGATQGIAGATPAGRLRNRRREMRKNGLAVGMGHKKGGEGLENLLEVLVEFRIPYFSFWGSSRSNLVRRPKEEVDYLSEIYKNEFSKLADSEKVRRNRFKINVLGAWRDLLPDDVKKEVERAIENTKDYDQYFFNFFIAYSGIEEILDAAEKISQLKIENPEMIIDREAFKNQLWTKDLPEVDLLIRTGGEPHNSEGFMMWDVANSQMIFLEKLWPDFTKSDLKNAIQEYGLRERRLGK